MPDENDLFDKLFIEKDKVVFVRMEQFKKWNELLLNHKAEIEALRFRIEQLEKLINHA